MHQILFLIEWRQLWFGCSYFSSALPMFGSSRWLFYVWRKCLNVPRDKFGSERNCQLCVGDSRLIYLSFKKYVTWLVNPGECPQEDCQFLMSSVESKNWLCSSKTKLIYLVSETEGWNNRDNCIAGLCWEGLPVSFLLGDKAVLLVVTGEKATLLLIFKWWWTQIENRTPKKWSFWTCRGLKATLVNGNLLE